MTNNQLTAIIKYKEASTGRTLFFNRRDRIAVYNNGRYHILKWKVYDLPKDERFLKFSEAF